LDKLLAAKDKLEQDYIGQAQELKIANSYIAGLNSELMRLSSGSDTAIKRLIAEIEQKNEELARLRAAAPSNQRDTVFVERVVEVRVEVPVEVFIERAVPGEVLVLRKIFFANNCVKLKPESVTELNRLVQAMRANPSVRVEIAGHTDCVGTLRHNQWLSEERAKAVRDYLIQNGIAANRLQYTGYNYSRPIATNSTPEGRARNRRVEIKIQ